MSSTLSKEKLQNQITKQAIGTLTSVRRRPLVSSNFGVRFSPVASNCCHVFIVQVYYFINYMIG